MTCRQTPVRIPERMVSDFANHTYQLNYVPEWGQWLVCIYDNENNDQRQWVRDTTGEKAFDVAQDHCFWEGAPDDRRIPEVLLQRASSSMAITTKEAKRLLALTSEEISQWLDDIIREALRPDSRTADA